jgi:aspartyl/asparaginyl beta-hydroxylase (cupin superfamily)
MNTDPILDQLRLRFPAGDLSRVEECVAYLGGEREPIYSHPMQEPTRLFFPGLSTRPWHDTADFPWVGDIESSYEMIQTELCGLLEAQAGFYPYEDPYTLEIGWRGWDTFSLYRKGKRHARNSARCPETMRLLSRSPHGLRQAMFTKLHPGAHLTPHTGGVNVVLTCHLGLVIPDGCAIRVGGETRAWTPGRCLVFDDSFVHEAWNHGSATRIVLLWDVWHPGLTALEIEALRYLFPIFDRALGRRAEVGGPR